MIRAVAAPSSTDGQPDQRPVADRRPVTDPLPDARYAEFTAGVLRYRAPLSAHRAGLGWPTR